MRLEYSPYLASYVGVESDGTTIPLQRWHPGMPPAPNNKVRLVFRDTGFDMDVVGIDRPVMAEPSADKGGAK